MTVILKTLYECEYSASHNSNTVQRLNNIVEWSRRINEIVQIGKMEIVINNKPIGESLR